MKRSAEVSLAHVDTNTVIAHLVQVPRDGFLSETIISPLLQATHKLLVFIVRTPFTLAPFIDWLLLTD